MRDLRAFLSAYFEKVAEYQAEALLTLLYWTVIAAVALVVRLTGRRLLPDTFGRAGSHWIPRPPAPRDEASLRRQY